MKGIKQILGVLAVAGFFCLGANAQENKRGPYETNKAFDNTFIGIGIGINSVVGDIANFNTWGLMGLGVEVNFGKWWTPSVGMRLGYHGLLTDPKISFDKMPVPIPANTVSWQVPYTEDHKYGFHFIHGDLLWNISNTIGGYKETRFWDFIPYFQMGLLDVSMDINPFQAANLEYAAGPGLINELRLGKRVNCIIDLSLLVGQRAAYIGDGNGIMAFFPSATVGIQVNLGKTGWERHTAPVVIPVPFTLEQYNSLAERAEALEKENAALREKASALQNELDGYRKQLVDGQTYLYENGTFTAVDVKPGTPVTVYFDCGSTKISAREKAHLEYFTANVVDENTKLAVNGYADKQTGSAGRNQYLSEQRARAVKDFLVKAGAKEGNIECAAHGTSIQLFDGAEKNRVVTVEVK